MLCQQCQKEVATVHFTQIINNKKTEMYLCKQCANRNDQVEDSHFSLNDFLSGFLIHGNSDPQIAKEIAEKICNVCGMSFDDFRKTGKLGCENCYKIYGNRLNAILKRLHGNVKHTGKVPGKAPKDLGASKDIEILKDQLNKAIQNEEYEKAAEFRDRIKQLESEKPGV